MLIFKQNDPVGPGGRRSGLTSGENRRMMVAQKGKGGDNMGKKLKKWLKTAISFLFNPRFLLCFGIGWMITNGWSYIIFSLGTWLQIPWMIAVGGAYLAFLWLPISPEKLITVAIAIWLLKRLFPNDQRTLAVLIRMKDKLREAVKKKKKGTAA